MTNYELKTLTLISLSCLVIGKTKSPFILKNVSPLVTGNLHLLNYILFSCLIDASFVPEQIKVSRVPSQIKAPSIPGQINAHMEAELPIEWGSL